MKRLLITASVVVASVVSITAFAVAAPFSPVKSAAPKPNVVAQYGNPAETPPKRPAPSTIESPKKLSTKPVKMSFPVKEAGVKVTVQLRLTAKQARLLGLKVGKKAKYVVLGTATATTTEGGEDVSIEVSLRDKVKKAIAANKGKRTVVSLIHISLVKDGKKSIITKRITIG